MSLLFIAFVIAIIAIALKVVIKLNTKWNSSYVCLVGKTVIVTGANAGLGYATATDFAMRGARVILACRSKERAEEARRKIVNATGNENVVIKLLDLSSFKSVREFANDFNQTEERLDILVNNAGAMFDEEKVAEGGLPFTIKVNHLSPFLLTHLLMDKLKRTQNSRIVNVSSFLANYSTLQADAMNTVPKPEGFYSSGLIAYNNSKLCNILFTRELHKKLEGTGIRVYTVHPGIALTEFQEKAGSLSLNIFVLLARLYLWIPEEGAQTTIYASVSKKVEGHEGEMFANCKEIGVYARAKNVELAKKVWENSEKFVELSQSEKL